MDLSGRTYALPSGASPDPSWDSSSFSAVPTAAARTRSALRCTSSMLLPRTTRYSRAPTPVRRPLTLELQPPEKLDFLRGRRAAEGRILQERLEPGLFDEVLFGLELDELKLLHVPGD